MGAYRDTHPDIGEHLNALHSDLEKRRAHSVEELTKHKIGLTDQQQNKLRGMLTQLRKELQLQDVAEEPASGLSAVAKLQASRGYT